MTNIQLVADECVDEIAVAMLRKAGYLVHYISEKSPSIKDTINKGYRCIGNSQ